MDALLAKGPLDTRQLALRVTRAKGLSESDKVLAQTVALRRLRHNTGDLVCWRKRHKAKDSAESSKAQKFARHGDGGAP